jgi:hypothetical protein
LRIHNAKFAGDDFPRNHFPERCLQIARMKRSRFPQPQIILLFVFCLFLGACRFFNSSAPPSIEFTQIPPATRGGRDRVSTIAGRVKGARPGQRIVVYALSGPWWVQPWPDQPFLTISNNSEWSTQTHLGYEYAALLVGPDFHPPGTMDTPPTTGGSVVAVTIVKGVGTLPPPPRVPLQFSGYDWQVETTSGVRGGLNHLFAAENASTDSTGALHLRIIKKSGNWICAHVLLSRSLGYGTYTFVVRDTSHLEPSTILSMETYDEWGGDQHYREMDIEVGRWGDAQNIYNVQYGIQPFFAPGNLAQFTEPSGTLTYTMFWEPGRATFKLVRGSSARTGSPVVYQHVFTSGVPTPGKEQLEFMFYVVASDQSPQQNDAEVVVEKFQYLP